MMVIRCHVGMQGSTPCRGLEILALSALQGSRIERSRRLVVKTPAPNSRATPNRIKGMS